MAALKSAATSAVLNEIALGQLLLAILVLSPLICAAAMTGQTAWLRAGLLTISTFIAMQRSGLAPLGVLLHGLAIGVGFMALLDAMKIPELFVLGCTMLAAGSILITAKGSKLRSLGNFTFIPALYLACETSEGLSAQSALLSGLDFLPFAAFGVLPTFCLSAITHFRGRDPADGYIRHWCRLSQHIDRGDSNDWFEPLLAVAVAVMVASTIVEWRHLGNGQWVIWSAASVVTGNYASARLKLAKRGIGALIGVPIGIVLGQFIPHETFTYDLAVLLSILTLVAFKRYVVGFATRCSLIAMAFILAGSAVNIAAERVFNVLMGGLVGYGIVVAVHAVGRQLRLGQSKEI